MQSSNRLLSIFDKFLLSGLGCGVIGLCVLICGFFYVARNPPAPRATPTPVELVSISTVTPTASISNFLTSTLSPTFTLPVEVTLPPTHIPSPPSGKIVFTCYVKQIDQICLMNSDGTERRQLTDFQATAFYASLSPDGQAIFFASRRSGHFEIYSINIDGTRLDRLTDGIGSLYAPELSPDGGRIVFTNNTGGKQRIWIMRSNGRDPQAITESSEDIDPTWSPDGSRIAFASARTGQRQLFVMSVDGSNIRQVTDLSDMGGRSSWSPDGTRLAFYRGPTGDHNIYVINVDGTGLVELTNGGDNLGPSWSPDGNWIAFTSFRDGNNEIYIMHPDGTGVTRLTNNSISDWQPRWGR